MFLKCKSYHSLQYSKVLHGSLHLTDKVNTSEYGAQGPHDSASCPRASSVHLNTLVQCSESPGLLFTLWPQFWLAFCGGKGRAVWHRGHIYELWSWLTWVGIPVLAPTSCVILDELYHFSKPCFLHLKTCIVESIKQNNRHFVLSTVPCTQHSVNRS